MKIKKIAKIGKIESMGPAEYAKNNNDN